MSDADEPNCRRRIESNGLSNDQVFFPLPFSGNAIRSLALLLLFFGFRIVACVVSPPAMTSTSDTITRLPLEALLSRMLRAASEIVDLDSFRSLRDSSGDYESEMDPTLRSLGAGGRDYFELLRKLRLVFDAPQMDPRCRGLAVDAFAAHIAPHVTGSNSDTANRFLALALDPHCTGFVSWEPLAQWLIQRVRTYDPLPEKYRVLAPLAATDPWTRQAFAAHVAGASTGAGSATSATAPAAAFSTTASVPTAPHHMGLATCMLTAHSFPVASHSSSIPSSLERLLLTGGTDGTVLTWDVSDADCPVCTGVLHSRAHNPMEDVLQAFDAPKRLSTIMAMCFLPSARVAIAQSFGQVFIYSLSPQRSFHSWLRSEVYQDASLHSAGTDPSATASRSGARSGASRVGSNQHRSGHSCVTLRGLRGDVTALCSTNSRYITPTCAEPLLVGTSLGELHLYNAYRSMESSDVLSPVATWTTFAAAPASTARAVSSAPGYSSATASSQPKVARVKPSTSFPRADFSVQGARPGHHHPHAVLLAPSVPHGRVYDLHDNGGDHSFVVVAEDATGRNVIDVIDWEKQIAKVRLTRGEEATAGGSSRRRAGLVTRVDPAPEQSVLIASGPGRIAALYTTAFPDPITELVDHQAPIVGAFLNLPHHHIYVVTDDKCVHIYDSRMNRKIQVVQDEEDVVRVPKDTFSCASFDSHNKRVLACANVPIAFQCAQPRRGEDEQPEAVRAATEKFRGGSNVIASRHPVGARHGAHHHAGASKVVRPATRHFSSRKAGGIAATHYKTIPPLKLQQAAFGPRTSVFTVGGDVFICRRQLALPREGGGLKSAAGGKSATAGDAAGSPQSSRAATVAALARIKAALQPSAATDVDDGNLALTTSFAPDTFVPSSHEDNVGSPDQDSLAPNTSLSVAADGTSQPTTADKPLGSTTAESHWEATATSNSAVSSADLVSFDVRELNCGQQIAAAAAAGGGSADDLFGPSGVSGSVLHVAMDRPCRHLAVVFETEAVVYNLQGLDKLCHAALPRRQEIASVAFAFVRQNVKDLVPVTVIILGGADGQLCIATCDGGPIGGDMSTPFLNRNLQHGAVTCLHVGTSPPVALSSSSMPRSTSSASPVKGSSLSAAGKAVSFAAEMASRANTTATLMASPLASADRYLLVGTAQGMVLLFNFDTMQWLQLVNFDGVLGHHLRGVSRPPRAGDDASGPPSRDTRSKDEIASLQSAVASGATRIVEGLSFVGSGLHHIVVVFGNGLVALAELSYPAVVLLGSMMLFSDTRTNATSLAVTVLQEVGSKSHHNNAASPRRLLPPQVAPSLLMCVGDTDGCVTVIAVIVASDGGGAAPNSLSPTATLSTSMSRPQETVTLVPRWRIAVAPTRLLHSLFVTSHIVWNEHNDADSGSSHSSPMSPQASLTNTSFASMGSWKGFGAGEPFEENLSRIAAVTMLAFASGEGHCCGELCIIQRIAADSPPSRHEPDLHRATIANITADVSLEWIIAPTTVTSASVPSNGIPPPVGEGLVPSSCITLHEDAALRFVPVAPLGHVGGEFERAESADVSDPTPISSSRDPVKPTDLRQQNGPVDSHSRGFEGVSGHDACGTQIESHGDVARPPTRVVPHLSLAAGRSNHRKAVPEAPLLTTTSLLHPLVGPSRPPDVSPRTLIDVRMSHLFEAELLGSSEQHTPVVRRDHIARGRVLHPRLVESGAGAATVSGVIDSGRRQRSPSVSESNGSNHEALASSSPVQHMLPATEELLTALKGPTVKARPGTVSARQRYSSAAPQTIGCEPTQASGANIDAAASSLLSYLDATQKAHSERLALTQAQHVADMPVTGLQALVERLYPAPPQQARRHTETRKLPPSSTQPEYRRPLIAYHPGGKPSSARPIFPQGVPPRPATPSFPLSDAKRAMQRRRAEEIAAAGNDGTLTSGGSQSQVVALCRSAQKFESPSAAVGHNPRASGDEPGARTAEALAAHARVHSAARRGGNSAGGSSSALGREAFAFRFLKTVPVAKVELAAPSVTARR